MTMDKSYNITLSSQTLSDQFSVQTYQAYTHGATFSGAVHDFAFSFVVDSVNVKDKLYSLTGKYDIDDLLAKPLSYYVETTGLTASGTMAAICSTLGKSLSIGISDFSPDDLQTAKPTARDVIGNLFGWTSQLPQRMVNVFLRGSTLYVIQRGHESGSANIVDYANPSVTRRTMKTLQSGTDTAGNSITGMITGSAVGAAAPEYLSGTFTVGDTSITYSNGLVTSETHDSQTTTYTYSSGTPPAYMTKKSVALTDGGKIETIYTYSDGKLVKEVETEYDSTNKELRARTTRHFPLGQGVWATEVTEDGERVSASIGTGAPSGQASAYAIREGSQSAANRVLAATLPARVRNVSDNYPIADSASLAAVAASIEWLNGKTEERVELDCYDADIKDFTKTHIWQGNTYYLDGNSIMLGAEEYVQHISLVRWY